MTRRALAAAALLCVAVRAQAADGCAPTPVSCNQVLRGRLSAGDCVRADGTLHDAFEFNGAAGRFVRALVYPQSAGLSNPSLTLLPPAPEVAPIVTGGLGMALSYVLKSDGKWTIDVGTRDLGATGDYVAAFSCNEATFTGLEGCVPQYIHCGQSAEWILTPNSCHFSDVPDRFYATYSYYGVAGDILSLSVESDEFSARVNLYRRPGGGSPIARSRSVASNRDVLTFPIPETGLYDIAITSRFDVKVGRYKLTVDGCLSPGCLPPVILEEPADVAVPFGATAKLTAKVLGIGPVRYLWFDRAGLPPILAGEGQTFTTPRITRPMSFALSAVAPCGAAESRVVTVRPSTSNPRERAARH